MTQGRENLNAILGTKINFRKEGLGFNLTNKKKFDIKIVTFVSKQETPKFTPLIKMNYLEENKNTQNSINKTNLKDKGKKSGTNQETGSNYP